MLPGVVFTTFLGVGKSMATFVSWVILVYDGEVVLSHQKMRNKLIMQCMNKLLRENATIFVALSQAISCHISMHRCASFFI